MQINDGDSASTDLLQSSSEPRNLIMQIFIRNAATNMVRRCGLGRVSENEGTMPCLLLRLLTEHVNIPAKTKVLGSIRLGRDGSSPRNRGPSPAWIPLLGMGRLLPVLVLRLWSVQVVRVVGSLWGRLGRLSILIEIRGAFAGWGCGGRCGCNGKLLKPTRQRYPT